MNRILRLTWFVHDENHQHQHLSHPIGAIVVQPIPFLPFLFLFLNIVVATNRYQVVVFPTVPVGNDDVPKITTKMIQHPHSLYLPPTFIAASYSICLCSFVVVLFSSSLCCCCCFSFSLELVELPAPGGGYDIQN